MKTRQKIAGLVGGVIALLLITAKLGVFQDVFTHNTTESRREAAIFHLMRRNIDNQKDLGTGKYNDAEELGRERTVLDQIVDILKTDRGMSSNASASMGNAKERKVDLIQDALTRHHGNITDRSGELPRRLDSAYGVRAKNGRCYLDKLMTCEAVFSRIYECLAGRIHGREPLPNYYLNAELDDATSQSYRRSSIGFVHLPKAGGTSVEEVLSDFSVKRQWTHVHILHCTHFFRAATLLHDHNSNENVLFTSKRTFGLHNFVNPSVPFFYLTWFRDPVSRVVSAYYYIKKMRNKTHKLYGKYVLRSKNLTDCLERSKDSHFQEFDNYAVRLMQFGDYPVIDTTFEDCCGAYTDGVTQIPEVTEEHYLVAKQNLETKMAFVGLLEDFKTSQDMLCFMLQIPCPKEEVHVNSNKHQHELTDFERTELERRNHWDIKLYEDAKRIYEKQKAKYLEIISKSARV